MIYFLLLNAKSLLDNEEVRSISVLFSFDEPLKNGTTP